MILLLLDTTNSGPISISSRRAANMVRGASTQLSIFAAVRDPKTVFQLHSVWCESLDRLAADPAWRHPREATSTRSESATWRQSRVPCGSSETRACKRAARRQTFGLGRAGYEDPCQPQEYPGSRLRQRGGNWTWTNTRIFRPRCCRIATKRSRPVALRRRGRFGWKSNHNYVQGTRSSAWILCLQTLWTLPCTPPSR